MRWLGVFAVVAGCGRIFFDPRDVDAGPSADGGEPCAGEDAGTDAGTTDAGRTDAGSDADPGNPDAGPSTVCPAGYVLVAANDALMTPAFCVMQFEAKAWADADADGTVDAGEIVPDGCDAGCLPNWATDAHLPVAVPEGRPWREVSFTVASRVCRALGLGYDLISNPEAMTLAREVERVARNWSGGAPGAGRVPEGRTDVTGRTGSLDVQNVDDAYDGTGHSASEAPGTGWEQRRVLYLSSGAMVWDFPGNVQEWVDWDLGGDLTTAPPCPAGVWSELPAFSCPGYGEEDFDSSTGTYDSTHGMGRILGGGDGAMRRGGQVGDLTMGIAGLYGFNLNRGAMFTAPSTGFRCVFRPTE